MDPYYNTTFGTSSLANYHCNDGGWVVAHDGWAVPTGSPPRVAHGATQYATAAPSGHNAIHGHSLGNTYQGCNSCHAVHGANTMDARAVHPEERPGQGRHRGRRRGLC